MVLQRQRAVGASSRHRAQGTSRHSGAGDAYGTGAVHAAIEGWRFPNDRAKLSMRYQAQRLGRLLRPKSEGVTARLYAVVARDTVDTDFAANRQRFLAEQGYGYRIMDAQEALAAE